MEEVKNTNRKRKASIVKGVVSGDIFLNVLWMKHRYYILLWFGLVLCYISQRYYVEQVVYAEKKMETELKNIRVEYTVRSSEFMRLSKRSAVEQEIKKRSMPLVAPQRPPKQIKID